MPGAWGRASQPVPQTCPELNPDLCAISGSDALYCAFETFKISSRKPAHKLYGATYGLLFVAKPRQ